MKEDTDLLYAISVMYYRDGLNQKEISDRLNISRPMISRMLTRAQELGIVEISIHKPEPLENIAYGLERRLGLEKVLIAPNARDVKATGDAVSDDIADYAAHSILHELARCRNIGVGWGSTVYKTVMRMVETSVSDYSYSHNIAPIVGSVGVREAQYQVNIIVSLLAHVLGGSAYFYNSAEASRQEYRDRYQGLFELWESLDAVVFGLGPYPILRPFPSGTLSDSADSVLSEGKAVGDVLGRFFSEKGEIYASSWGDGYLGLSIESLKKVGKRICLCGGIEKIHAIEVAASLNIFNVLVTDMRTAEALLR